MLLGLLVGAWVARYLGPEGFGLLNGALAIVAVAGVLASLGLPSILVRELATFPANEGRILGTAFFLRMAAASMLWIGCVGIAWSGAWTEGAHRWLLPIAGLALLIQSVDVVERKLQAQGNIRQLACIRIVAVLIVSGLRIGLILTDASVEAFALAGACELAAAALGLGWMISRSRGGFGAWSVCAKHAVSLLREGLPLVGAGLAIQIQAYSDQIMIGAMRGSEELGQYAAALRVVVVFSVIAVVMQTVVSPEIARAKADDADLYRRRLHRLYRLAMVAGVATAGPLFFFGPTLVDWLFGEAYLAAGALLPLLALRLVLANMGVARGIFLTTEGMARFVLITATAGAILNVGLNLILIPKWGATGAIVSSLISFSLTTFGLEWADRRAKWNFRIMAAAMLRPWRSLR